MVENNEKRLKIIKNGVLRHSLGGAVILISLQPFISQKTSNTGNIDWEIYGLSAQHPTRLPNTLMLQKGSQPNPQSNL